MFGLRLQSARLSLSRILVCAAAVLIASPLALATDRLTLSDGTVVEGEIRRELNGNVWLENATGQTQYYSAARIVKIERDVNDTPAEPNEPGVSDPAPSIDSPTPGDATAREPEPRRARSGAPRAAVLSYGDADSDRGMVGTYLTAESLRRAIPLLEEEEVDIVVFRVNSGGGAVLEIERLSDVLHNEYKPKFRTVSWIDYAISAASLSPHTLNEHYFMERGAYGGNTAWFGRLQAVKGRDLEEILYMAEKISERGGHDPKLIRAMQILEPLSADFDENGRMIALYQNTEGEYIINKPERVLALTSDVATKIGFADGVADTLDELAAAMGLTEVEWVGKEVEGVPWPVSKAEQHLIDFRAQTAKDEQRINEYGEGYQVAVDLAQGAPRDERGKFVSFARRNLSSIKRMVNNNPNLALFILGMDPEKQFERWYEEQEQQLRDLLK
ncbi:MAG: hypothetical protein AAFX79_04825 [Planctomycetota bacterium]